MSRNKRMGWQEARDTVQSRILKQVYTPGEKLPTDAMLAAELGCARITIQRAMSDLARNGLLERRRKSGTRIKSYPATQALVSIPLVCKEVEARGGEYGYLLLSRQICTAPRALAASTSAGQMLRVQAAHYCDHRPFMYEDRWVSLRTAPEILSVNLNRQSANQWLVKHKPYSRCDVSFRALNADDSIANKLEISAGQALLLLERKTWMEEALITLVKAYYAPEYQMHSCNERSTR